MFFSLIYLVILLLNLSGLHGCEGRRIVAVGDLHGDLNQTLAVLRLAGLIDDRKHWVGKDAYFVQLGDVLDVGPDDLLIVRLFMKLEKEAKEEDGNVIQLLGNHEIRNLLGDYTAADPTSLANSGGKRGRDHMLSVATDMGMYLRTRKALFHHKEYLFMHGGFSLATSSMITSLGKIEEFNTAVRNALVNNTQSAMGQAALNLNEDDNTKVKNPILVRSILNVRCEDLASVLDKHFVGIRSVVVGHVPHDPRDFSDWRLCDGRLIDIDFGLSRWKKGDPGHVAALEIDDVLGHAMLMESTVQLPDFKPDVHDTETGSDVEHSFPLVRLAGVVVLVALVAGALGIWMLSCFRAAPTSREYPESTYGSCA